MLNKKSLNEIQRNLNELLNFASAKYAFADNNVKNISPMDVDVIELKTYATIELLELAYINDQLDRISFHNINDWLALIKILKSVNYRYVDLLIASFYQLLRANGFTVEDANSIIEDVDPLATI